MLGTKRTRVYISLLATLCVAAASAGIWIFFKGRRRSETSIQHVSANDPKAILAEANHFAFLSNSYRAGPLYAKAEEMFRVLMGEKVEPRREFIQKHALEVKEIDYHGA